MAADSSPSNNNTDTVNIFRPMGLGATCCTEEEDVALEDEI